MSRVTSALVESKLATLVADAPLLDASADALLSDDELPALAAVCSALGVPLARSTDPPDSQSLPMRLITGGVVAERTLWRTFADAALHELLTRELMDALVSHLSLALDRCERAGVAQPTILEVGAGNGMLTYQLARRLGSRARVVAVDDGSSRIATQAEVHVLDQATALARFAPQIVLACWMPSGCDWTAGFRECASVREYLLLGHPSACGDEWATWGRLTERSYDYGLSESSVAPHATEGWVCAELGDVSQQMLCRLDSTAARGFSVAVAFAQLASLVQACEAWPRAWPVAPSYSGVTADAKWAGLTREWRQLCAPKEGAREVLLTRLRAYRDAHHHGVGWAQEVPTAQLAVLAEAIADYDSSMAPAPSAPPQRREYVENWLADHEEAQAPPPRFDRKLCRLAFERASPLTALEHACHNGSVVAADYYVFPEGAASTARVHANRTHAVCRVGDRYLLTRGKAWLELHVTQSGGASCGADKGLADVRAAGFGPLAGLHEVGECWELSVVAEL